LLGAAALLLAVACRPADRVAHGPVALDDAGDTVRLPAPARRIVSLIPATTELLFDIGAGSAVVGRTTWCDYPPAALQVPDLGDGIRPNLEAIVSRRPDLVVLYNSAQNASVANQLQRMGIRSIRLAVDRLSDVSRVALLLGRLSGRERGADSLVAAFDAGLEAASTPDSVASRPTVLILVWDQPPMTVGRGSFLSEMVQRAGGRNLFADIAASSAAVSLEAIAARNPDVVLTTTDAVPKFASRPEWRTVPAVREGRFVPVPAGEFSRPSPRAPAAIRELADRLRELRR